MTIIVTLNADSFDTDEWSGTGLSAAALSRLAGAVAGAGFNIVKVASVAAILAELPPECTATREGAKW